MSSVQQHRLINWAEHLITFGLLIIIFASPVFIYQDYDGIIWELVQQAWLNILPFAIALLLNHFVLIPYYLFSDNKALYLISATLVLIITAVYFYSTSAPPPGQRGPSMGGPPPHEMSARNDMRPPPPRPGNNFNAPGRPNPLAILFPPFVNAMIITLLMIGFDTGLRSTFRWTRAEREKMNLEKENVKNRLSMLQNQVSPHFFMNTLNNVHALIDIDTEQAKNAVIQLSKMMRHLLQEPESGKILLQEEINFIRSYVDLMSLRYSDKVEVTMDISDELSDKDIPPLLFTSLIENAFKYGVSYKNPSFVNLYLSEQNGKLNFKLENSKHDEKQELSTGIGIQNSQSRLDLLYRKNYHMEILENEDTFTVELNVPYD
ncbi:MAG: histidine kinase [Cyclobacteriaceae bacterium]